MATVADILAFLETLAPASLKMEWDNVGLLCGSKSTEVTKILVALDPFEGVCREAADIGAQLIVTHHPLIFRAPNSITDETSIGRSIMFLCRHGISAVNAHTNLDVAPGGVNDVLAEKLGLQSTMFWLKSWAFKTPSLWRTVCCGWAKRRRRTFPLSWLLSRRSWAVRACATSTPAIL